MGNIGGVVGILALLGYLFLLIDWKEMRAVLVEGGWAVSVVYAVLTILIVGALSCPAALPAAGMHHG